LFVFRVWRPPIGNPWPFAPYNLLADGLRRFLDPRVRRHWFFSLLLGLRGLSPPPSLNKQEILTFRCLSGVFFTQSPYRTACSSSSLVRVFLFPLGKRAPFPSLVFFRCRSTVSKTTSIPFHPSPGAGNMFCLSHLAIGAGMKGVDDPLLFSQVLQPLPWTCDAPLLLRFCKWLESPN